MTDRQDAVCVSCSQGACRLSNGQRAADTVIGDATVGALEIVANTHMAKHVVRKISQQPHRVNRIAEFLAKNLEFPGRNAHCREEIVIVLVIAATRTSEHTRAIIETCGGFRIQGSPVILDLGLLNRFTGSIETKQIRA